MKKKVLFTIWTMTGGGGAERILANIVNGLPEDKYEIDILEYTELGIRDEDLKPHVKILKPLIRYKNAKYLETASSIEKLATKLKGYLYEILVWIMPNFLRNTITNTKYDIEVAFTYQISTFLVSNKAKSYCWIHTSIEDLDYTQFTGLKRIKTKFRYLVQKKHLKKFNEIIAISNKTQESIEKVYPEFKHKIVKIYNGYEFSKITSRSKEEIAFEKTKPTIIAVGRLQKQKNFLLLIDVANELKAKGKDFEVLILGEGEEKEMLQEKINQYNLQQQVKMLGYINNPFPYMKQADVYCMTSLSEGFPTVLVEALNLGCPFVSTDVAGADELADNGKCGFITSYDAKDIAHSLIKILDDPELRDKMSYHAKVNSQNYSMERQIENIEQLFNMKKN